jgi:ribosomal RNA-processing protein 12
MSDLNEDRTDHLLGLMEMDDKLQKIRTQINSKLENQKKLAVVLQTIDENLKDQNQNTTPITYFVSFLTLLDQCCDNDEIKDLNLATCALYFLDLVAPYTPSKLLKSKFSDILVRIAPTLTNESADAPLIRSSIGFLESLLLAQDSKSWNNINNYKISPKRALSALLDLSLDPRPKVRKRAQEALLNILKKIPNSNNINKLKEHPAASYSSEFALNNLINLLNEKSSKKNIKKDSNDNNSNSQIIHNLQLITSITSSNSWPLKQITPLCDVLLEICKSADQYLISSAFGAFEGMFKSMTNEIDSKKFIKVLDIIFDLKPSLNDPHLAPSWLAVIAKAVSSFSTNVNSLEILLKLPDIFSSVGSYFLSDNSNITESAAQCLIAIIVDGIKDKDLLQPPAVTNETFEKVDDIITKISEITSDYLTVRYRQSANDVCEVISALFVKLRQRANPDFLSHLELIGDWRSNEQEGFELNEISEKVIASAISSIGPEVVLQVLPLNLTDPKKIGRAWLLPILRDNVQMAQLNYYIKNILPIVEFFQEKVKNGNPNSMNTKIFTTIIDQIWSLLPYFCFLPLDLQTAFSDDFAAKLSGLLYEEVQLRPVICNALKNLVVTEKQRIDNDNNKNNDENSNIDLVLNQQFPLEKAKSDLEYLSTTKASKLLSVLFNVFTKIPMDQRNYVAEAIEAYFTISSNDDMIATFNKVCVLLRKALDDEKNEGTLTKEDNTKTGKNHIPKLSVTMMDLIVMMTKYLPTESHNPLLTIFNETVRIENSQIQKRSYRIISKLLDIEDQNNKSIITPLLSNIIQVFIETSTITLPSARPQRLEALEKLIKILPRDLLHFITGILSEVIDSTRSANEKTRTTSFKLLTQIGNKFKEYNGELIKNTLIDPEIPDSQASIQELFLMCCAAAGPEIPHQRSAAITALSCIFYEFHKDLDISYQKELMQFVEVFLHQNNREVIKPTLGFMKVAILSLPEEEILPELKGLLTEFLIINNKHKNHFKSKIKHLIERMIRKFGFDVIDNNIPEEDKKIINGIRKAKNRTAKQTKKTDETGSKSSSKGNLSGFDKALYEESDSDNSDDEVEEQQNNSKSKKAGTQYISESKEVPLDLLDKQALAHISTSRPKKFNKKSVQELTSFKTKDGKLIIKENDDDDILSNKNSLNAYVEAVRQGPVRGQKNKLKWKKQNAAGDIDWDGESDDESKAPKRKSNFKSKGNKIGKSQPKFKSKKKF